MSVAFRRDGDEEHLEPKFEVPIAPGPNLVTARGLDLLKARAGELAALAVTLTEETALNAARRDLRYIQQRLVTAQLAPVPDGAVAAFGCRVDFTLNGAARALEIVGHDEADAGAGRIAFTAPLARALLGCEPGDLADFGGQPDAIEVTAIRPI
ncbi:GreA/GreB family elongation factor [Novosphingobium sp.]|uniref:GreA/GreB family elongation factor n=1 Tax=Novosphingobium sp. TaxID=1874826 RepID=UPI002735F5B4|nr:GreA/GreB family elongation factor [Novosphingobium sp.]MDP3905830.1 GreA/GreB family elongation factor [Novosphingobium sp.]